MEELIPAKGYMVVELTESEIANIELPDKQYSTKTSGIVAKVSDEDDKLLIGRKVYFDAYKDDVKETIDGREFAFIKMEDLRGYAKPSS